MTNFWIILLIIVPQIVIGTEFTFDLPDSEEQCFYELISSNTSCTFEFQVSLFYESLIFLFVIKIIHVYRS